MREGRAALAIGVGAILGSCRIDAGDWPAKVARAMCDHAERCDPTDFAYVYEDADSCRTLQEAEWRSPELVGCVFDDREAKACLDALRSSCEASSAPCLTVWRCGATADETSDTSVPPL